MDSNFYNQVHELVRLVPFGKVTTYGAIANALGAKGSARLVGYAMNQSHLVHPKVPAHRVVNRNGMLSGKFHFEDSNMMQSLLENEGIVIIADKIQNFKNVFWDPLQELTSI